MSQFKTLVLLVCTLSFQTSFAETKLNCDEQYALTDVACPDSADLMSIANSVQDINASIKAANEKIKKISDNCTKERGVCISTCATENKKAIKENNSSAAEHAMELGKDCASPTGGIGQKYLSAQMAAINADRELRASDIQHTKASGSPIGAAEMVERSASAPVQVMTTLPGFR